MPWFSKAFGGEVEQHNQKLWAIARCNFAAANGEAVDVLGVYKRNPTKHPDEPNLLPDTIAKVQAKKLAQVFKDATKRGRARA